MIIESVNCLAGGFKTSVHCSPPLLEECVEPALPVGELIPSFQLLLITNAPEISHDLILRNWHLVRVPVTSSGWQRLIFLTLSQRYGIKPFSCTSLDYTTFSIGKHNQFPEKQESVVLLEPGQLLSPCMQEGGELPCRTVALGGLLLAACLIRSFLPFVLDSSLSSLCCSQPHYNLVALHDLTMARNAQLRSEARTLLFVVLVSSSKIKED